MDILMLTKNDWANTGYKFYQSLKLAGFDVQFYKGAWHGLNYPVQAEIHPALRDAKPKVKWRLKVPQLRELAESAKALHFIASTFVGTEVDLKNKFVVVQHGGSMYRQSYGKLNQFFNKFVNKTIIQCPDLLGLGAKNETLIYYPIDVNNELLQPNYEQANKKIITLGHFPRSPKIKGTHNVLQAVSIIEKDPQLKKRVKYVGIRDTSKKAGRLPWEPHLKRVAKCDVIIETCNLKIGKQKYGEWANTALEAACLGNIVISNTLAQDIYNREYGELGIHVANDPKQIVKRVRHIADMTNDEVLAEKMKTRRWVEQNHSLEANAKRLKEKIYTEGWDD